MKWIVKRNHSHKRMKWVDQRNQVQKDEGDRQEGISHKRMKGTERRRGRVESSLCSVLMPLHRNMPIILSFQLNREGTITCQISASSSH